MTVRREAVIKTQATAEDWAEASRKARKALDEMTPEEDAEITADALGDPDNPPIDDDAEFMSWEEARARLRGRTQVALDRDVIERFRKAGDDWEERSNAILRDAAPADAAERTASGRIRAFATQLVADPLIAQQVRLRHPPPHAPSPAAPRNSPCRSRHRAGRPDHR